MDKNTGINLALVEDLWRFDTLLAEVLGEYPGGKLRLRYAEELADEESPKFQIGRYMNYYNDDGEPALFWMGYGWEENKRHEKMFWLEFNRYLCPDAEWEALKKLVGTDGDYYAHADSEYVKMYKNEWIHFYLKDELLALFFDGTSTLEQQKAALASFLKEILSKL
jgi:hypothetical protein